MGVKVRATRSGKYKVVIDHKGYRRTQVVGTKKAAEAVKVQVEAPLALGNLNVITKPASAPAAGGSRPWNATSNCTGSGRTPYITTRPSSPSI